MTTERIKPIKETSVAECAALAYQFLHLSMRDGRDGMDVVLGTISAIRLLVLEHEMTPGRASASLEALALNMTEGV